MPRYRTIAEEIAAEEDKNIFEALLAAAKANTSHFAPIKFYIKRQEEFVVDVPGVGRVVLRPRKKKIDPQALADRIAKKAVQAIREGGYTVDLDNLGEPGVLDNL